MEKDTFAITFTSLSIILLCFFIFLNSRSELSENREHAVLHSIAQQFAPHRSPPPIEELVLQLPATELFLPQSDIIKASAVPQLHRIVSSLQSEHKIIMIFGQTCVNAPIDSNFMERQRLTLERNASLVRFIIDVGVQPRAIMAEGAACRDPLANPLSAAVSDQYSFATTAKI